MENYAIQYYEVCQIKSDIYYFVLVIDYYYCLLSHMFTRGLLWIPRIVLNIINFCPHQIFKETALRAL